MKKLQHYGVTGKYIDWIKAFLKGRNQVVQVNGACSYPTPVNSGVPQGSVLGPLLFIIYINDLTNTITDSHILTFADDTKIITEIHQPRDTSILQSDLNRVIEWSQKNKMELNNDKFELICHRANKNSKNIELLKELPFSSEFSVYDVSSDIQISPSPFVKDLGIYITSDLNWDVHITKCCKKATQVSAWILHVFYTRNKEVMLTLFNSLVRSLLEYCPEVWNPYKKKNIVLIEQVQRSFTSKINGMKELNYWERLAKLNILSLQRMLIIIVWKIKNGLYPNSINLQFKLNRRPAFIKADLQPMPTEPGLRNKFDNSFVIKAAKLWNKLPPYLTYVTDLVAFKAGLDKFLIDIPDLPPIPGYPTQGRTNSITEY